MNIKYRIELYFLLIINLNGIVLVIKLSCREIENFLEMLKIPLNVLKCHIIIYHKVILRKQNTTRDTLNIIY